MFAIVDSKYRFIHAEAGINGVISDGGIYNHSVFKQRLDDGLLNLPSDLVFVGDGAFPLRKHMMKHFGFRSSHAQEQYYNKQLSRSRNVVENAFGVLVARFRVLLHTLNLDVELAKVITVSCCILHNFLLEYQPSYLKPRDVDKHLVDQVVRGG